MTYAQDHPGWVPKRHGAWAYGHGCRCAVCRLAGQRYNARVRERRFAGRQLIDGRLVAVDAPDHASYTTYANWGCRCESCTEANRVQKRKYRKPQAVQS